MEHIAQIIDVFIVVHIVAIMAMKLELIIDGIILIIIFMGDILIAKNKIDKLIIMPTNLTNDRAI